MAFRKWVIHILCVRIHKFCDGKRHKRCSSFYFLFFVFFFHFHSKVYYTSPIINFKLNFCSWIEWMGIYWWMCRVCCPLFFIFLCVFFPFSFVCSLDCSIIGHRHQFIWIPELKKKLLAVNSAYHRMILSLYENWGIINPERNSFTSNEKESLVSFLLYCLTLFLILVCCQPVYRPLLERRLRSYHVNDIKIIKPIFLFMEND